jgi:hypothetical protein
MTTLDRLDEERRDRVLAPLRQLTDSMVIEDTGAIYATPAVDTVFDYTFLAEVTGKSKRDLGE